MWYKNNRERSWGVEMHFTSTLHWIYRCSVWCSNLAPPNVHVESDYNTLILSLVTSTSRYKPESGAKSLVFNLESRKLKLRWDFTVCSHYTFTAVLFCITFVSFNCLHWFLSEILKSYLLKTICKSLLCLILITANCLLDRIHVFIFIIMCLLFIP